MAATFVITCPECRKKFKGREELQGRRVRCPNCGHGFIVQTQAQDKVDSREERIGLADEPAPPPPAEEPRIKSALDEELEAGSNPYGVTTLDLAPRCPNCANEMASADARICLHCGYDTLARTVGKTEKVIEHTTGERLLWLLPGLLCAFGVFSLFLLQLFYCFALPGIVDKNSWVNMFNHESMRLWIGLMLLGLMWGLGKVAQKRLIFHPNPPEKTLD